MSNIATTYCPFCSREMPSRPGQFSNPNRELCYGDCAEGKARGESLMKLIKIRQGICPDCGNASCMADGVNGLWCPNCDGSYLL